MSLSDELGCKVPEAQLLLCSSRWSETCGTEEKGHHQSFAVRGLMIHAFLYLETHFTEMCWWEKSGLYRGWGHWGIGDGWVCGHTNMKVTYMCLLVAEYKSRGRLVFSLPGDWGWAGVWALKYESGVHVPTGPGVQK